MTPFRPRNPEENMSDYLKAKQVYESGQNMNPNQVNPTLGVSYAPGFVPVQPTPQQTPQPTQTPTPQAPVVPPQAPTTPTTPQNSYIVQQGDTLSTIANKMGVPVSSITGYKSGNPNLIYPGEQLSIGQQELPPKDVIVDKGMEEGVTEEQPVEEQQDYSNDIKTFLSQTYGIDTSNLGATFSDPVASIKKIVEEVMASTGMPEIKTQLDAIAKSKTELENQMNDEIASINDNPWLSEGLRQKKVQAVKDKYESKVNSKINEFNLLQDMYDSARQEAQYSATLATNIYQNEREFLQGQLEFITSAAEKAASAKATKLPASAEEYQYAVSQGFDGSFMDYQKFKATQYGTETGVKPPTSAQYKFAGYAERMESSNNTINSLTDEIMKMSTAEFALQKKLPNWAKSSTMQMLEQAQQDFINAKLREESGAAIADSEFKNAERQYFPQPGDSKEVIALKKKNREMVINNQIRAAGSAYESMSSYGDIETGISQISNTIQEAEDEGYSSQEILSFLGQKDPSIQEKIDEAKSYNYSFDDVLLYIKESL